MKEENAFKYKIDISLSFYRILNLTQRLIVHFNSQCFKTQRGNSSR